jgi:hypothetical protein
LLQLPAFLTSASENVPKRSSSLKDLKNSPRKRGASMNRWLSNFSAETRPKIERLLITSVLRAHARHRSQSLTLIAMSVGVISPLALPAGNQS